MATYEGRCLCGQLRYSVGAPTLFCAHCHCRYCREAHGAAFVTWVGAALDRFAITAGEGLLRWYASSEQSERGFCANCGTTLFFRSTLCPGEMHVTRASLPGPIDREPQLHCFHDQRVAWAGATDDLPKYDTCDPGLAKYRAIRGAG
jgi:hypothetical protein